MDTVIRVSPFNPKLVTVIEPADPTVLMRINGHPMRIVGLQKLSNPRGVHTKQESGWTNNRTQPPPLYLVERKD
jgi:hypothetical protein